MFVLCDLVPAEFERDLEVHASPVWHDMRAERADALLLAPNARALAPASRWRPILRALLSALRKHLGSAEHTSTVAAHLQARVNSLEAQVSQIRRHGAGISEDCTACRLGRIFLHRLPIVLDTMGWHLVSCFLHHTLQVVKVEELGASLSAHQALHAEARAEAQQLQSHAHSLEVALMVGGWVPAVLTK
jgi:kinesin family protein 4/21/27